MKTPVTTLKRLIWLANVLFLGWIGGAGAEVPKEINFGVASIGLGGRPFVGGSVSSVAHVKGWLEEEFRAEGIKVNWHFFKTAGPGVNEAYSNGALDFAWQGDLPQLIGRAGGLKVKYILGGGRRGNLYLAARTDSTANGIEGIKGRKLGLHKGTCLQLGVARLLADHGIREKDLKVYNMDYLTSATALGNGELELTFGLYNLYYLRDQGLAKLIYGGKDDGGKYGCAGGYTVAEAFADQYPDITQRVVNALVRANYWTVQEENRDEVYKIWAKSGIPLQHFREDWDGQNWTQKLSPLIDDYLVHSYRVSFEDAKKFGLVRGKFDLERYFDRRYLDKALSELQLQGYWKEEDPSGKPKS
jgi:sulfonate transport system substrate-binding protein